MINFTVKLNFSTKNNVVDFEINQIYKFHRFITFILIYIFIIIMIVIFDKNNLINH